MPVEIIRRYLDGTYKHLDKRTGKEMFGYEIQLGVEIRNGKEHVNKKRKSGFPTRELAQEARAAIRLKPMLEEHGLVKVERVKFIDLLTAWLADARDRALDERYIGHMEFIADYFAGQFSEGFFLDQVTAEKIREFKYRRKKDKTHVHSTRKDLVMLGGLFNSAKTHFPTLKWMPPPINKPQREYDSRDVVLTPGQIAHLLATIDGLPDQKKYRDGNALVRDYIIVALHTARRESEILSLERKQVDFTERDGAPFGRIHFELKKQSKAKAKSDWWRVIPMTAAVAEIMRRRSETSRNEYLFIRTNLVQVVGALTRAFKRVCKKAEIAHGYENDGAVIHTLRHSAVTYLASLGLPIPDLVAILGHEAITTSLKYLHATPQGISAAIMALARFGVRLESSPTADIPFIPSSQPSGDARNLQ